MLKLTCRECEQPAVGNGLLGQEPVWVTSYEGLAGVENGHFHLGSCRCAKHLAKYGSQVSPERGMCTIEQAEAAVRRRCEKDVGENLSQYVEVLGLEEATALVVEKLRKIDRHQKEVELEAARKRDEEKAFCLQLQAERELEALFGKHPALGVLRLWRHRMVELAKGGVGDAQRQEAAQITDEAFRRIDGAPLELIVLFLRQAKLLRELLILQADSSKELMKVCLKIRNALE